MQCTTHKETKLLNKVRVIDLFAGPGGLGEGFFSFKNENDTYPFEGLISVEKDLHAHATLTLRAFYRLLIKNNKPVTEEYFNYIAGKVSSPATLHTEHLWEKAQSETLLLELGKDSDKDKAIFQLLKTDLDNSLDKAPTLLIGGPPCQAYSLVGRARNKGNKAYIPEDDHRHFLYKEYLATMELFSPDVFVMENVKGMLSSKINGGAVFEQIIQDLEECADGYQLYSLKTGELFVKGETSPKDFILCSEDYGIPQNRHRIIILGIKKNLASNGLHKIISIDKAPTITVRDAIGDLPKLRSPLSNRGSLYNIDSIGNWTKNIVLGVNKLIKSEKLDPQLVNNLKSNLNGIISSKLTFQSTNCFETPISDNEYIKFVRDSDGDLVKDHESRPHMDSDLLRYFYCSTFRETYGKNARVDDFPEFLAPAHKNWKSGKFVDRFKVQSYESTSSTITSHISKDGHYFIHSDPIQCRSLTVREAARLQTFPDSYQFMGKRTNQLHQVGNAVPPLLANKIATVVFQLLSSGQTTSL